MASKNRTPLEEEKATKLAIGELSEQIDEMGQENDAKAAKAVIELHNEADKKSQNEEAEKLEVLEKKRKFKIFNYKEQLAIYVAEQIEEEFIPKDWHYLVEITDHGIRVRVGKGDGTFSRMRQFRITGEAKYDLHACTLFAYWVGDVVYHEMQQKKSESGIILPN